MSVLEQVRDTFDDLEYTDAFERGRDGVLTFRARVGSQTLEGTDLIRLDEDCRSRDQGLHPPASGARRARGRPGTAAVP